MLLIESFYKHGICFTCYSDGRAAICLYISNNLRDLCLVQVTRHDDAPLSGEKQSGRCSKALPGSCNDGHLVRAAAAAAAARDQYPGQHSCEVAVASSDGFFHHHRQQCSISDELWMMMRPLIIVEEALNKFNPIATTCPCSSPRRSTAASQELAAVSALMIPIR